MVYLEDGKTTFARLERFVGHVAGRFGSFILQGERAYDGVTARGDWPVVPGSATGELTGLTGKVFFSAPHGFIGSYSLDYQQDSFGMRFWGAFDHLVPSLVRRK